MSNVQTKFLLKAVCMYLLYFVYSMLTSQISAILQLENTSIVSFVADFLFTCIIIFAYRKELKEDANTIVEKYSIKKILKKVLIGIGLIMLLRIVMGIITELIAPGLSVDSNTASILDLLKSAPIYAIFKTMIFAVVSEELLFRKSISCFIKNNWVFVFAGALAYPLLNFVFSGGATPVLDFVMYYMTAVVLNYIYVKNDRNIYIVMIVKFILQFLPFIVLLTL